MMNMIMRDVKNSFNLPKPEHTYWRKTMLVLQKCALAVGVTALIYFWAINSTGMGQVDPATFYTGSDIYS